MDQIFRQGLLFGLAVVSAGLVSCSTTGGKGKHEGRAEELGVEGEAKWVFRRVVEEPESVGLHFPGYLVALEKGPKDQVGAGRGDGAAFAADVVERTTAAKERLGTWSGMHRGVVGGLQRDRKAHFISHVVKHTTGGAFDRVQKKPIYNYYADRADGKVEPDEAFSRSFDALDALERSLRADVEDGATHVFLYCMGWNTDQQEALRNYNSLFGEFLNSCEEDAAMQTMKPVFVGISWDSLWGRGGPVSYFNKADDADEVGATWINLLLNQRILPLRKVKRKSERELKVVVVGHSFGARLLSTAVYGRPLLTERWAPPAGTRGPDLVMLLQGAVNVGRWIGRGENQLPVYDLKDAPGSKLVMTWSKHDRANPWAFWTSLAGGADSPEEARGTVDLFEFPNIRDDGTPEDPPQRTEEPISYYDASRVINDGAYRKGGNAHSDIYTPELGVFTREMVRRYAW